MVNHLIAVLVIVDLIRLSPGLNRIHVTTLNECIPHGESASCLIFGHSAHFNLGVMLNFGFVDVAAIAMTSRATNYLRDTG